MSSPKLAVSRSNRNDGN